MKSSSLNSVLILKIIYKDISFPTLANSHKTTDGPHPTKLFFFLWGLIILVQREKILLSFAPFFSLKAEFKTKLTICFWEQFVLNVGCSFVFSIKKGQPLRSVIDRLQFHLSNTFHLASHTTIRHILNTRKLQKNKRHVCAIQDFLGMNYTGWIIRNYSGKEIVYYSIITDAPDKEKRKLLQPLTEP